METQDQIIRFKKFIEEAYYAELLENCRKGKNYLLIDFKKLAEFDIDLSNEFFDSEDSEDVIQSAKIAVEQFDIENIKNRKFQIQINNLPKSFFRQIRSKRICDLDKLLTFEGIIRAKTKVLPQVTLARFECPSCGNILPILQKTRKFKEPSKCGCGRKGKFKMLSKDKRDIQRIEIEELPENVKGSSQPQTLRVVLIENLADKDFEPKFNPGAKVSIVGILKDVPITLRQGGESTESEYVLEALYMENIEEEEIDLNLSDEDLKKIEEISKSKNSLITLKKSIAPSIYGHDKIKEGILLQLVGGTRKITEDGIAKRGDIHILLIGDPGCGKSALLQRIEKIVPYARVANGKGSSGPGLTAAVVRDDFVGWTFQAGTLVLAHKNIAIIDEFDKISKEDRDQIHEALEQQTVTIAKAGVQARLRCECSLLAGANPKYGKFDMYSKSIIEQINLPPTLINRFDLIYPIRDIPNPATDKKLAKHILNTLTDREDSNGCLNTPFIRKYIFTAKKIKPYFSDEALEELETYYLKMRSKYKSDETGKPQPMPISARQLEGLKRLSEAYAKLRMSNIVSKKDAKKAAKIMEYCLKKIALDEETGEIDIDKIATGTSISDRTSVTILKAIIDNIENEKGISIPIDDVYKEAKEKGLSESQIEKAIEKMRRVGDIFKPTGRIIQKL